MRIRDAVFPVLSIFLPVIRFLPGEDGTLPGEGWKSSVEDGILPGETGPLPAEGWKPSVEDGTLPGEGSKPPAETLVLPVSEREAAIWERALFLAFFPAADIFACP